MAGRFLTKGSRHPDRRRWRSLRGGAFAQGLGNREGTSTLQDAWVRSGENLQAERDFAGRHGVSADLLEGGDSCRRRIASTSLRFGTATHVACRLIPACSGTPRARSRMVSVARRATRREGGASRERRPRDRSQARVAEGMAPRSSCHEARGERSGAAQVGLLRANADRGGSLARRRIESSCGCARASKNVRQKLDVRVLALSKRHARFAIRQPVGRKAGASFVGTPRAHQN